MFRSSIVFFLAATTTNAAQLRRLTPRQEPQQKSKGTPTLFQRKPAPQGNRRLLNGGYAFIVSAQTADGVEWCMDAVSGTWVEQDGQYPSMGLRPCAFLAGPTEQLFLPIRWTGNGSLESAFPGDFCLQFDLDRAPHWGDYVRLGPCGDWDNRKDEFSYDIEVNEAAGQIKLVSDPTLCVTFGGNHPDDDDPLVLGTCEDTDKFKWMFRSGWYYLGSGEGCVQVRDNDMSVGNRIVTDNCQGSGFGGHWRMDPDGLLRSRLDESFCMRATGYTENSPIRLAKCDSGDGLQRWSWPDGFEAPITLQGTSLNLSYQGATEEAGDAMVLKSDHYEFSGDAVH